MHRTVTFHLDEDEDVADTLPEKVHPLQLGKEVIRASAFDPLGTISSAPLNPAEKSPSRTNSFAGVDLTLVDRLPEERNAVTKPEEKKQAAAVQKVPFMRLLLRFASTKDKFLMFFGLIGAMAGGAVMPIFSIIFGELIDSFAKPKDEIVEAVTNYAYMFIGVGAAGFVAGWMQLGFWAWSAENQTRRLRRACLRAILSQDVGWFDTQTSGSLTTRLASDTQMFQAAVGEKVSNFVMFMSQFVTGLIVGFVKGWQLALIILAVMPLLAIAGGVMARRMSMKAAQGQASYATAGSVANETLTGIRTVATFGGEERDCARYGVHLLEAERSGIKGHLLHGSMIGVVMIILFGSYGLALWYGTTLIGDAVNPTTDELYTGGDVMAVFFAVLMGAMALGQAAPNIPAIAAGQGAAYPLFEIIDRVSPINPFASGGKKLDRLRGEVELDRISFCYPTRPTQQILSNFSLKINAGDSIAFVGPSGCGKSSLVQLLERFYDPQSGRILVDGVPLTDLNVGWWRQQVGLVSQEPLLFDDTITANIKYGNPDATQQEVEAAARASAAHDFICRLPDGYDSKVGEEGKLLSGGQKQRIAIARALVKNPSILLLDEATSALDNENEAIVHHALSQAMRTRTTIMVAHRLSTVRDCTKIIVLTKDLGRTPSDIPGARIIESGSHEELMRLGGVYASMVQAQAEQGQQTEGKVNKKEKAKDPNAVSKVAEKAAEKKEESYLAKPVPLSRVFTLIGDQWGWMLGGFIGALANGTAFPLFSLIFSSMIANFLEPDKDKRQEESEKFALLFFALGVGMFVAHLLQTGFIGISSERLTKRIRQITFRQILRQHMGWHDNPRHSAGIMVTRLASDAALIQGIAGPQLGQTLQILCMMITGLTIAFINGWKLALVILAVAPAIAISGALTMKLTKGFSASARESVEKAGQLVSESLGQIRTVVSFNQEQKLLDQYCTVIDRDKAAGVKSANIAGIGQGVSKFIMFAAYALSYWYGAKLVADGEMDFGNVMKVLMAVMMSAMGIGQTGALAPDAQKAKLAAAEVFALIDAKSEIDPLSDAGSKEPFREGEIVFEEVGFEYPSRRGQRILNGTNLRVPGRKSMALVGTSGCGKSTLMALIQRYYDPLVADLGALPASPSNGTVAIDIEGQKPLLKDLNIRRQGRVLIDGVDIMKMNVATLRSQIGVVGQEPVLFSGTIMSNIKYGNPDATEAQVFAAAEAANIHQFILGLQDGYQTKIGPKGLSLSGGQKQRVAIARAIVRNPKILLLDEATSALDSATEKVVQQALNRVMVGRTTLIIAHRLSTIRNCDYICVLGGGKVLEGPAPHDELMRLNGVYASMVRENSAMMG